MQSFSLQRWGLLVGKHWAENKKRYLLSLAAFAGMLLVWFVFIISMERFSPMSDSKQRATYFVALFIGGTFYASQFFGDLGERPRGINYLMLPASLLEKLLCSLFYTFVCFFIAFTATFYLVDSIGVALANAALAYYREVDPQMPPFKARVINVFTDADGDDVNVSFYLSLLFFAVQSAFLLGSVYFRRYSFIKTAIAIFFVFLFTYVFERYLMHAFLPEGGHQNYLSHFVTSIDGAAQVLTLPDWVSTVFIFALRYAFAPLFWLITYYRLQEKEV